jgi:two-component system, chemotaxis family, chemotaxis protein CheY
MLVHERYNGKHVFRSVRRLFIKGTGELKVDIRILVVEDSEITRRMIRTVLETRDWTICGEAENGLAGVRQFQLLRPDVVVLDLTMPDIDGLEVAHRMSRLDASVPLILFTLCDIEEIMPVARRVGIYATVSKHRVLDLVETIESAMEDRCCPGQRIQ